MENEITYTEINGVNYPNLALPEQPKVNIGKYGHMRLDYLKNHRRGTYTTLLTEGRLLAHILPFQHTKQKSGMVAQFGLKKPTPICCLPRTGRYSI